MVMAAGAVMLIREICNKRRFLLAMRAVGLFSWAGAFADSATHDTLLLLEEA